jgi:hypothetical protein
LYSHGGGQPPWALVLEVEAAPKANITARSLEYGARLMRKVRHGPDGRDTYQYAAVVVFLSGGKREVSVSAVLPGTQVGLQWAPRVKCVPLDSAAEALEKIARRELGRSILAWVPLMDGGGEAATIAEWLRLAREEPNEDKRGEYGALALLFAEKADRAPVWKQALEGWDMVQSKLVAGWREEGRQEGRAEARREDLLKLLRRKFPDQSLGELTQLLQQQKDPRILDGWVDIALDAASADAFRAAIQPASPKEKPNGSASN